MREPDDLNNPTLRDGAVRAARGAEKFDLLITGGTVVDVATGELRAADVGIVGPLIASVHAPGSRSDAARRVDIRGKFIAPGLIDTHLHIESSMVTPRRYAETVVPQGTTTICWDPHELGNVLGLDGVRWGIEAARGLPLRILTFAPSCVPSAPGLELAGAEFEAPEMATMLGWLEVAGVAEVMDMRGVLDRTAHMQGIVGAGLNSGKLVCGHARGLTGKDLQAFGAAGMESDHELTSGDDLLEKVRAGFTIELRGSHDYVLPGIVAALKTLPRFPQTVTTCTDDIFPDDLVRDGGIIDVLRRLVGHGMQPVDALQAATLNAADTAAAAARPRAGGAGAARRPDRARRSRGDARHARVRIRASRRRGRTTNGAGACDTAAAAGHNASRCSDRGRVPPACEWIVGTAAHRGEAALHRVGRSHRAGAQRCRCAAG